MEASSLISFIDLTSLSGQESMSDISQLCQKAMTSQGPVAAVCIYPPCVKLAKACLPETILVATVVNFPLGSDNFQAVLAETKQAIHSGADEIDVVFPYERYWAGEQSTVIAFLSQMRATCSDCVLKVIVESALWSESELRELCQVALTASPDFLKTSTGKKGNGASLIAARSMLEEIKRSGKNVGFKASGGIVEVSDAIQYAELTQQILGELTPKRFRLGASRLLDHIL